jgi:hypothetical protein
MEQAGKQRPFEASSKAEAVRMEQDTRLVLRIKAAHRRGRSKYGSPRIFRELCQGGRASRKRIARLMSETRLKGAWGTVDSRAPRNRIIVCR